MFTLNNVSKSFGSLQVLKPTTVDFRTGESTVLIGPSGCGKSTLLRILVGLIFVSAFNGPPKRRSAGKPPWMEPGQSEQADRRTR